MASDEIQSWPDRLQLAIERVDGPLRRVHVIRETDSTQDAARQLGLSAGEVVVAGRQRSGRGRLGSRWADTADAGIAMTFCVQREPGERLAFLSAVATAMAAESLLPREVEVAIKWPNDIYARLRKLAGILIEQQDQLAFVGIGMNVLQSFWPEELGDRAISLSQLSSTASRCDAMESVLTSMSDVMNWSSQVIADEFHTRHMLRNRIVQFASGERRFLGRVVGVCLEQGLQIETDNGRHWLSAGTARFIGEPVRSHDT